MYTPTDAEEALLQSCVLFRGLDPAAVLPALRPAPVTMTAGSFLLQQGERVEQLYVLLSGALRAARFEADGSEFLYQQLLPGYLAGDGVRLVIGDPEATPIGKIANQVFADFGIADTVNIVSNTATAPAMTTALTADEADAILVWKENVNTDEADIVDSAEMEAYVKTIPAARLTCSDDAEAADGLMDFLSSDAAHAIWTSFGYELAEG